MELYFVECLELHDELYLGDWDSKWFAVEQEAHKYILALCEMYGGDQVSLCHIDLFPGLKPEETLLALLNTEEPDRTTELLQRWLFHASNNQLHERLHFRTGTSRSAVTSLAIDDIYETPRFIYDVHLEGSISAEESYFTESEARSAFLAAKGFAESPFKISLIRISIPIGLTLMDVMLAILNGDTRKWEVELIESWPESLASYSLPYHYCSQILQIDKII